MSTYSYTTRGAGREHQHQRIVAAAAALGCSSPRGSVDFPPPTPPRTAKKSTPFAMQKHSAATGGIVAGPGGARGVKAELKSFRS